MIFNDFFNFNQSKIEKIDTKRNIKENVILKNIAFA